MMLVLVTVFLGLQYYRAKTNPQTISPNSATTAPQTPAQTAPQASVPASQSGLQTAASLPAAGVAAAPTMPTVQASSESATTIENELYSITFTNRGGQVTSWI